MLSLIRNDRADLGLDLSGLLKHEVRPRKFLLNLVVVSRKLRFIRVGVKDVHCEPACRIKLNDLEWTTIGRDRHTTRHQLQLLSRLLAKKVQVHRAQELL